MREIICEGVNGDLIVTVVSDEYENRDTFWFTMDSNSEIGRSVVIENDIGARVSAKRIK